MTAALAIGIAACGGAGAAAGAGSGVGPTGSSGGSPTASDGVPATPAGSPAVSAPIASATQATSASAAIRVDEGLLDALPDRVAGLDRQVDRDVEAQAFADPSLASIATAGAAALYGDQTSGDFAFVTVLRLAGGRIDDGAFRAYRDSFDAGACSQAGGVAGHAEAQLGGRETFIATCGGGVRTYHALLPASGAILSISSLGTKNLGAQLAAAAKG